MWVCRDCPSGTELKLHEAPVVDIEQLCLDVQADLAAGPAKENHGRRATAAQPKLQHHMGRLALENDEDGEMLKRHWVAG